MLRAIILVHKRIATNSWTQIDIESLDAVGIKLISKGGEISIYNLYNNCTHSDTLSKLQEHLDVREQAHPNPTPDNRIVGNIWLGDFNKHHPMWENKDND